MILTSVGDPIWIRSFCEGLGDGLRKTKSNTSVSSNAKSSSTIIPTTGMLRGLLGPNTTVSSNLSPDFAK